MEIRSKNAPGIQGSATLTGQENVLIGRANCKGSDIVCSVVTTRSHSSYEQPELRAYKLGKQKCSYNQVELAIKDITESKTGLLLKVSEAIETPVGAEVDEKLRESCLKFNVRFVNNNRMHLYLIIVYSRPHNVIQDEKNGNRYQWMVVTRSKCQKGCTGPIIRGLQRFGRMSKRSASGEIEESWKEPRHLYIAVDEASTHVCPRFEASKFRFLAAAFDDTYQLLGTCVSSSIRVLANNDAPLGAAFLKMYCNIKGGWGKPAPTSMLQIDRKSSKKARIPFQDIQNQKRFSPAKSPKEKNGLKSLEHFVLTAEASSTGADGNQYPCNEPVEEPEKIEELSFGKTTLLKRQTRAYSEDLAFQCRKKQRVELLCSEKFCLPPVPTTSKQKSSSEEYQQEQVHEFSSNETVLEQQLHEVSSNETVTGLQMHEFSSNETFVEQEQLQEHEAPILEHEQEHSSTDSVVPLTEPQLQLIPALETILPLQVIPLLQTGATQDTFNPVYHLLLVLSLHKIAELQQQNPAFLFHYVRYSRQLYNMFSSHTSSQDVIRPRAQHALPAHKILSDVFQLNPPSLSASTKPFCKTTQFVPWSKNGG